MSKERDLHRNVTSSLKRYVLWDLGAHYCRWKSPERLLGEEPSIASDVWALGVTLWEVLSFGATPYPGGLSCSIEKIYDTNHIPSHSSIVFISKCCRALLFLDVLLIIGSIIHLPSHTLSEVSHFQYF